MRREGQALIDPRLTPYLRSTAEGLLDLRGCDLSGLELVNVNLEGALLMGASLRGCDLTGAQLFGAQLTGADLTDARLSNANLSYAHLQRSLLIRTELSGASLGHVYLNGAVIRDVSLQGALVSKLPEELFDTVPRASWLALRDGWCCRTYEWLDHLSAEEQARPPVIALHGMTGSGLDFQELAYALGRPLISLDLYGHGETLWCRVSDELALDDPEFMPEQLSFAGHLTLTARWLEELLTRRLSAEQGFELLGYSMGGRLALSLVAHWTEVGARETLDRLERLTLIGASPGLEGARSLYDARRAQDHRWAERFSEEPLGEVLESWDAQPVLARLREVRPELARQLRQRRARQAGEGLAYAMRAVSLAEMPSQWGQLAALSCPTRWVTGALDQKFTAIAARAARAQGPHAEAIALAEAGHSPHLERPAEVAALLERSL